MRVQQCSLFAHNSPGSQKSWFAFGAQQSRGHGWSWCPWSLDRKSLKRAPHLGCTNKTTEVPVGFDHQTGRTS